MRLSQKVALHTGIQIGGKIISLLIGLFSIGLMTRFLGTDGYGNYSTVITFLSLFSIAADFGLYLMLTREVSRSPNDQETIASNIFTLRLVSALLIIGLAPLIAFFFPYAQDIKIAILWGVAAFIFASLTQVLVGIFQKEFKTQVTVMGEIASRVVFLAIVVWLFFYFKEKNLILLIFAVTVANFINFIIVFLFSQRFLKIRLGFDRKYWKYVIKESFPIAASIVLGLIYFKIDTIMLSVMKTPHEVGIYGVAYKILEILIVFPGMFISTMLPLFSRTATEDFKKFKSLSQYSLNFLILFMVPVVIGGFLLARPLIILLSGQSFAASADALKILIIATGVIFIGNLFGHLIVAVGAQKKMIKVYFIGALLNIALNLILIPDFSYIGSSIATLITELLVLALSIAILKNSIKYLPSFKLFAKALVAGGVMAIMLLVTLNWSIFILVPLGALIYFLVLYSIKGLPSGILGLLKT